MFKSLPVGLLSSSGNNRILNHKPLHKSCNRVFPILPHKFVCSWASRLPLFSDVYFSFQLLSKQCNRIYGQDTRGKLSTSMFSSQLSLLLRFIVVHCLAMSPAGGRASSHLSGHQTTLPPSQKTQRVPPSLGPHNQCSASNLFQPFTWTPAPASKGNAN